MDLGLLSLLVGLVSASYLAGRTIVQIRRQRRSDEELPFVPHFELGDVPAPLDRARGAMVGVALGDALGAPREGLPVGIANLRYGRDPRLSRGTIRFMRRRGTVTDDTQHTWLVARCITDGGFDVARFGELLVDWLAWRIGEGRGTLNAVRAMRDGNPNPNRGQGNGAAMRVSPLAVAYRDDLDAMLAAVDEVSRVTHPDPEAIAGAEVMARATRALVVGGSLEPRDLLDVCLPAKTSQSIEEWERRLNVVCVHYSDPGVGELMQTTGWVFTSVPTTLLLWLRHGDDWRNGLRELYAFGGDTDTIGAMYMSLVGASRGASFFNHDLLREVQGIEALISEADRLDEFATSR